VGKSGADEGGRGGVGGKSRDVNRRTEGGGTKIKEKRSRQEKYFSNAQAAPQSVRVVIGAPRR